MLEPDFRGFGVCSNATPKTIATKYRIIISIEPGAEKILPAPKRIIQLSGRLKLIG
jgi:hypothetical protein